MGVLIVLLTFGLSGGVSGVNECECTYESDCLNGQTFSCQCQGTPVRPVIPTIFTNNPPNLNGQMSAGEWNNLGITMTPPSYPIEAYAYFMNDGTYLYVLVDAVGDNTSDNLDECLLVFNFTDNSIPEST